MAVKYLQPLTHEQMRKAIARATANQKYWAVWNDPIKRSPALVRDVPEGTSKRDGELLSEV